MSEPITKVEDLVRAIHAWVEVESEQESILLGPNPQFTCDSVALLDFIYKKTGLVARGLTDEERETWGQ